VQIHPFRRQSGQARIAMLPPMPIEKGKEESGANKHTWAEKFNSRVHRSTWQLSGETTRHANPKTRYW
jgi:hypothetical protein